MLFGNFFMVYTLTSSIYTLFFLEMDGKVSFRKRLTALQLLSLLLPPLNRLFFKKLVELLHLVSERTINLMTSKNLAVVFAPNIASRTVSNFLFRSGKHSLRHFFQRHALSKKHLHQFFGASSSSTMFFITKWNQKLVILCFMWLV